MADSNEYFARASKLKFGTSCEHKMNGTKNFKKRTLGLFKSKKVISIEELATILTELHIVESIKEGEKLIPTLVSAEQYSFMYSNDKYIEFKEVEDSNKNVFIEVHDRGKCYGI